MYIIKISGKSLVVIFHSLFKNFFTIKLFKCLIYLSFHLYGESDKMRKICVCVYELYVLILCIKGYVNCLYKCLCVNCM